VKYLSDIRLHPNKTIRQAEMTLFCGGNVQDAEGLLLQSGLIFRAIMLNLKLYRWDRALELSVKYQVHLDTVIGYRQRYIEQFDKKETNAKYQKYASEVSDRKE